MNVGVSLCCTLVELLQQVDRPYGVGIRILHRSNADMEVTARAGNAARTCTRHTSCSPLCAAHDLRVAVSPFVASARPATVRGSAVPVKGQAMLLPLVPFTVTPSAPRAEMPGICMPHPAILR